MNIYKCARIHFICKGVFVKENGHAFYPGSNLRSWKKSVPDVVRHTSLGLHNFDSRLFR